MQLIGAYGGFKNAMGLFGRKMISDLSQRNYLSELSKASSLNDIKIKSYEIYMMAYLWTCCLVGKRFKQIKDADAKVK